MRSLALVRCLEIIGEAAATISPEFKASHPHIPWRIMANMRNRLIHAYFSVNLSIVLETSQQDLPPLIADLTAILDVEEHQDS